jgi:integrase
LRVRLQQEHRARELALVNLGIDSKLRACDLVSLKVRDITHGERVASRAIVQQKKTGRPVQFEITVPAREAVEAWIQEAHLRSEDYLFPSRIHTSPHICTRHYARMLRGWLKDIGLALARLRHAFDAAHKGHADLPQDQELARGATAARPFQAGLSPVPDYVPCHTPPPMAGQALRGT